MEKIAPCDLKLIRDDSFAKLPRDKQSALDPSLRRVAALVEARNVDELFRRTGIRKPENPDSKEVPELSLFVELAIDKDERINLPDGLTLKIPKAYFNEARANKSLTHVTARVALDPEIFDGNAGKLRDLIVNVLSDGRIKRLSLARPLQPCLADSLSDIGLPLDSVHKGTALDGKDIIVGIIDDGCALAHQDFLIASAHRASGLASRVQCLWDQSATPKPAAAGWVQPEDFGYGFELENASINAALDQPGAVRSGVVEADEIYHHLGYPISEIASHGTHVMSIAAGNGRSLMGHKGVAHAADMVFVQLPQTAITSGGPVLSNHILDGVMYIFARAQRLNKPAVVNISYGGYTGPHDGTTELESGMDQLLAMPGRTVVVAAGNGFEADCHARGIIGVAEAPVTLQWELRPEDPTANFLEVWYNGDTSLDLRLTPPGAAAALGPVPLGSQICIQRPSDLQRIGTIDHTIYPGNGDHRITIILASTAGEVAAPNMAAPSGIWQIELSNTGAASAEFHAWIERDASGGRGSARRQQSHFVPAQADPGCTLGSLATGHRTIAVGAYNTATQEICRYSAAGPTRAIGGDPGTARQKPEVCAPAEEDPAGRGTLSAASLRAQPKRMNGTSASAPHVTGLVALMYQYTRDAGRPQLTAGEMRDKIMQAALTSPPLELNRRQQADDTRPHKQDVHRAELTGSGKVNVQATLDLL